MRPLFLLLLLPALLLAGGGPESTLVAVNARSELSRRLAAEYVKLRDIPLDNVLLLDEVPGLGVISMDAFLQKIWAPIAARLKEIGPIRLVTYSADFPYAVRFAGPKNLPDQTRRIVGGQASLTGVTYLIGMVQEGGSAFAGLATNPYYGIKLGSKRGSSRKLSSEERTHAMRAYNALQQKQYAEACRQYEALLKTFENSNVYYNYACGLARARRPDDAMKALAKARDLGWRDARHTAQDNDLASLRRRPDFVALLKSMGGGGRLFELADPRPFGLDNAYLATHLAYTGFLGNSYPEVLAYLRAAQSVDGKKPDGTVYFCRNKNVRSTTREPYLATLQAELEKRGRKFEVLEGVLPQGKQDVIGAVLGSAKFDWKKSKSRILPGGIVEHLTSTGAHFDSTSQTKCTSLLRAGAAGSSGTVAEPYAIQAKFPNPLIHVFYADGLSLAEAFYRSLQGPYQLMIIGDGLARPFAEFFDVEVEAPPMPWSGTVELKPRGKPETWELWVDGRRMEGLSLDTTKLGDGEHDVRLVGITGAAGTRSYKKILAIVKNGNAARKPPAFTPPEERTPEPAAGAAGVVLPGLVGEMGGKTVVVTNLSDRHGGGSQATGPFKLKGVFRAPVGGFFQIAISGSGTVTVAGRCEKAPLRPQLFVPVQLAEGWHAIEMEYDPGRSKPRFEMMLHGEVVWQPLELGHFVKPYKYQPESEGTFAEGLLLKWKRSRSGIAGVALAYEGKPLSAWSVETTTAKRFKALKNVAVLAAPGYVRLTFAKPLRARQIRIKAAGEAKIKQVVVIAK